MNRDEVRRNVQAGKDYARACEEACRHFGEQPGTKLGLVTTSLAHRELLTTDQSALVSVRTLPVRTFARDGRTYRLSRVKGEQWPAVAAEIGDVLPGLLRTGAAGEAASGQRPAGRKPRLKCLADPVGLPVLYTGGRHFNGNSGGYVQFPGRRWLHFPVRGTRRSNAIMTAVDQAGRQVARYMIGDGRTIDITVHPDQQLTDELALTLALTAWWISSFFDSYGEGG